MKTKLNLEDEFFDLSFKQLTAKIEKRNERRFDILDQIDKRLCNLALAHSEPFIGIIQSEIDNLNIQLCDEYDWIKEAERVIAIMAKGEDK